MARVPASEATRKRLRQLFEGGESTERSALIRESVRLMIEEALEAEVSEALGRGYFEHGASGGAHRNGYRRGRLKAAEGEIEYGVPQVRGLSGWRSEVRAAVGGKSEELERLAIEMYARGLSLRDIEAAFTDACCFVDDVQQSDARLLILGKRDRVPETGQGRLAAVDRNQDAAVHAVLPHVVLDFPFDVRTWRGQRTTCSERTYLTVSL